MAGFMFLEWKGEGPPPPDKFYPAGPNGPEKVEWRIRPYCMGKMTAHILSPICFNLLKSQLAAPYDGPFNTRFAPDDVGETDWNEVLEKTFEAAPKEVQEKFLASKADSAEVKLRGRPKKESE